MFLNFIIQKIQVHSFVPMMIASLCLSITGCSNDISTSAEYQAACHGEQLTTVKQRNQARENGYLINEQYQCLDKKFYLEMQEAEVRSKAARSPEALAKKRAESEARDAQSAMQREQRQAQRREEEASRSVLKYVLGLVEINQASAVELAKVCSLGNDTAEMIVKERNNAGTFKDWADVVHRVIGLSSAQNVVYASTCGLVVNGASFNGAPADEETAQMIFQRAHR